MNLHNVINQYTGTEDEILQQVRDYPEIKGKLLSSEVVTMYLVQFQLYSTFLESTNPLCIATMRTINSLGEFNFILGSEKGLMNLRFLDLLIQEGICSESFKTALVDEANVKTYPYKDVTLEDIYPTIYPDTWKTVADNIPNNRRESVKVRLRIGSNVNSNKECSYKVSARLPNSSNFLPLVQSVSRLTIQLQKDEQIFYDLTLPFDRLVQEYKLEFKGPWANSISSVDYVGIL